MAEVSTYTNDTSINGADRLLGTNSTGGVTSNFLVSDLKEFNNAILSGETLSITSGATLDVNGTLDVTGATINGLSGTVSTSAQTFQGLKTFPNGIQVGANPSTFDSYRVGTWTPDFVNGLSFTSISATYTKVGDTAHLFLDCSGGTDSGVPAFIQGLPFTPSQTSLGSFLVSEDHPAFRTVGASLISTGSNPGISLQVGSGQTSSGFIPDFTAGEGVLRITISYKTTV